MAFCPASPGADRKSSTPHIRGPRVLINEIRRAVSDVVPNVPTTVFVLSSYVPMARSDGGLIPLTLDLPEVRRVWLSGLLARLQAMSKASSSRNLF